MNLKFLAAAHELPDHELDQLAAAAGAPDHAGCTRACFLCACLHVWAARMNQPPPLPSFGRWLAAVAKRILEVDRPQIRPATNHTTKGKTS